MAPPATEIAYITLKPGVDLEGPTPEAKALKQSLATIAAQDGFQRTYYGRQLEDPNLLLLVIDWDSKESHMKFVNDPSYGPFKETLGGLMEAVHLHHFTQSNTKLLGSSPVVEVFTFHDIEPGFLENVEKFADAVQKGKPKGYHGILYGKVMEKIVRHKDVGNGDVQPGEAVVGMVGWDSVEAHMEFRETDLFKENIGLLREKTSGGEVFHVPFTAA